MSHRAQPSARGSRLTQRHPALDPHQLTSSILASKRTAFTGKPEMWGRAQVHFGSFPKFVILSSFTCLGGGGAHRKGQTQEAHSATPDSSKWGSAGSGPTPHSPLCSC